MTAFFCSMKITQGVRAFAGKQGLDETGALANGMEGRRVRGSTRAETTERRNARLRAGIGAVAIRQRLRCAC
jgi:hypothetical protein